MPLSKSCPKVQIWLFLHTETPPVNLYSSQNSVQTPWHRRPFKMQLPLTPPPVGPSSFPFYVSFLLSPVIRSLPLPPAALKRLTFLQKLPGASLVFSHVHVFTHLILSVKMWKRCYDDLHFTEEETQQQRYQVTCPIAQSSYKTEAGWNPSISASGLVLLPRSGKLLSMGQI